MRGPAEEAPAEAAHSRHWVWRGPLRPGPLPPLPLPTGRGPGRPPGPRAPPRAAQERGAPTTRGPRRAFLPGRPNCFGRDKDLEDLAAHLVSGDPRPALLLGGPGIGKSTLALAALYDARVAARFGARRWFIRCDAAKSRSDLAAALAQALELPLSPGVEAAVLTALASAPAAVVLDNLETPWEADPQPVEEFLSRLAGVLGLALAGTLRSGTRPYGIAWRDPFSLRPLELPDARDAFLAVAGAHFAGDPRLDSLLPAVGCVPLAVTLLAYAAQAEPDLAGIERRWQEKRTAMLQIPGRTGRLENLDVSLALSADGPRMTPEARRLLALLGILPAGIAHCDLDALLPGEGDAAASTLRQVGLAFDEPGRLRVLAPVREYARAHWPPGPADHDRAVTHYLALARRGTEVGRRNGAQAVARLVPENANIEEMLGAALPAQRVMDAVAAATDWGEFVRFTGVGSSLSLHAAAETACAAGDAEGAAGCIKSLGEIALARSDHAGALARYEKARALYRQVGDVLGEANCIRSLGDIAVQRSDQAGALARYEDALALYRKEGSVLGEANCVRSLGDFALRRWDHDGAQARYEEALPLCRQVGDVLGEANCICRLGDIALARLDHSGALARYEEALPLFRQVGSVLGEANCIQGLGNIARERSDHARAEARYQEALPLYLQVRSVLGEANCVQGLGDVALARSDCVGARERYEDALTLYQRIPEPYSIGNAHRRLAGLAGTEEERRRHVDAARAAWESIDRPELVARLDAEFGSL